MSDVADAVGALRIDGGEIASIGLDRALIGEDRVVVAPRAQVDVRRHVQQVPRAGDPVAQQVGARQAPCRVPRRLLQVDPVVVRAGVVGREFDGPLQQRLDLAGPWLRRAVRVPPIVGMQVEQRLGGEQGDVAVARVPRRERAHLVRVARLVDRAAGGWRRASAAISACCAGDARARWRCASRSALATCGADPGAMSLLIVGPCTQASAHQHVAHDGSSRVAASNERAASAGLKP